MKAVSGGKIRKLKAGGGVRFLIPEAFLMNLRASFGRQWK
jgi:hypothetical protein